MALRGGRRIGNFQWLKTSGQTWKDSPVRRGSDLGFPWTPFTSGSLCISTTIRWRRPNNRTTGRPAVWRPPNSTTRPSPLPSSWLRSCAERPPLIRRRLLAKSMWRRWSPICGEHQRRLWHPQSKSGSISASSARCTSCRRPSVIWSPLTPVPFVRASGHGPASRYRGSDCGSSTACSCGHGRVHPRPDRELIAQFYPSSYYGVTGAKFVPLIEALVRLVGARHVRALSRGLRPGARVLDVGCGRGVLLSGLARRGFEAHGFEMSASAAAGVDPRAVVRVGKSLHDAEYPSAYFDQVIIWHVLEQLPDPRETLEEIRRILKPGGRLVVAVPNYSSLQARCSGANWFHLDPPRHLFHFPAEGLRQLLASTGFDIEREHHFSLRQNPFGWVQSALNCLPRLPRNGLYSLLKRRDDQRPISGRRGRLLFLAAYWLGMPVACVQSVIDARGEASVCMTRSRCPGGVD